MLISQIKFILDQMLLAQYFMEYDQRITEKILPGAPAIETAGSAIAATSLLVRDLGQLYCTLAELYHMLNNMQSVTDQIRDKLSITKLALGIAPSQSSCIDQFFDYFFYFNKRYALLYRNHLPEQYDILTNMEDKFHEVSVARFNFKFLIERLKSLDENNPEELKTMISILDEN